MGISFLTLSAWNCIDIFIFLFIYRREEKGGRRGEGSGMFLLIMPYAVMRER